MMNYNVSRKLIDNEDGIFRTAFINKNLELPEELDENTKNFITAWNSQAGEYVLCKDKQQHEWLKLETYCHITSPIRRLVDLLNSIIYQNKYGFKSEDFKISEKFYDNTFSIPIYFSLNNSEINKVIEKIIKFTFLH